MELKQLQYFVVSVDTGSFSKAAEILYTTQPHVSKTIQKMEKNLGMDLLKRGKKGVVMTNNGEKVYEQAQNILKSMQEIQTMQGKEEGVLLKLTSMPSNLLAGLFATFYQREKSLRARFYAGSLKMVLNQLCHRHADIGFVFISEYQVQGFKSMISYKRLEFELLKETRLVLFAGPKHPYYNRVSVTRAEMQKARYVQNVEEEIPLLHYPGHLKEGIVDPKTIPNTVSVCSDHAMMQLLQKTELGNISSLLKAEAYKESKIKTVELEDCDTKVYFGYVRRKVQELDEYTKGFVQYVRDALK